MTKWAPMAAVAAIATLSLLALYRLLLLQYDTGDAYPPYSSYRADPLGLLVLHNALRAASDLPPRRNLAPLEKASFPPNSTLLMASATISEDEVSTLQRFEQYVSAGGRLVILFSPGEGAAADRLIETKSEKEKAAKDSEKREADRESQRGRDDMLDALVPTEDISERWDFAYDTRVLSGPNEDEHVEQALRADTAPDALPMHLPWHSELIFTRLGPEWKAIYRRGVAPVVIERPWGAGSIVLASDNYLVSNEAIRNDRAVAYLAWLAGTGRVLVFEETHLGVGEATGVMALARRYGLIPLLLTGVLLALLGIWKKAASLVPRRPSMRADHVVAAPQSTVAGIANLVRRAVGRAEILETGWRLYQAPTLRRAPLDAKRRAAVEAALASHRETPARRRDPVAAYNQISAIINERKPHP